MVALFNPKIKLFVEGRKNVFQQLEKTISLSDKTIWVHCASLGEFEQGLPIIEQLKKEYSTHKIVVTFFSPSGYEVKKNSAIADIITYLPLDTKQNVKRFLQLVHPELAIFVKYEFWPNYLAELKRLNTNTLLVSGIFRKNQAFFKWHGQWMQKSLKTFHHFFVQNKTSKKLLNTINFNNVTIAGDTRFDRVSEILERDNFLPYIEKFKDNKLTIVYGSSWVDDESIYLDYLNNSDSSIKHIIAPHNIHQSKIENLTSKINKSVILFSEMEGKEISDYDVFIIDTIGLLTKIYSYADIAFVGGAFKTGLHNTLEPAVFGIPIIIGPNYEKFQEANDLVDKKGILTVNSKPAYNTAISSLVHSKELRIKTGLINTNYITEKSGATIEIIKYITAL